MMIPVTLDWQRDAEGYRLENMGRYGKVIVRNGGKWIATTPLAEHEMLYAEFAGVRTPEHLRAFANRHGYLSHAEATGGAAFYQTESGGLVSRDDGYSGEKVGDLLEAAHLVRQVMIAENSGKKSIALKDARTVQGRTKFKWGTGHGNGQRAGELSGRAAPQRHRSPSRRPQHAPRWGRFLMTMASRASKRRLGNEDISNPT
jgi:hypothetical protein